MSEEQEAKAEETASATKPKGGLKDMLVNKLMGVVSNVIDSETCKTSLKNKLSTKQEGAHEGEKNTAAETETPKGSLKKVLANKLKGAHDEETITTGPQISKGSFKDMLANKMKDATANLTDLEGPKQSDKKGKK